MQRFYPLLPGKLEEPTGMSSYNVVKYYSAGPEFREFPLNEAIDMAQNRPFCRLLAMSDAMHS